MHCMLYIVIDNMVIYCVIYYNIVTYYKYQEMNVSLFEGSMGSCVPGSKVKKQWQYFENIKAHNFVGYK